MFSILADTLRTALKGSKSKHQRLSYEEWEHRFLDRYADNRRKDSFRFNPHRDLW